MQFHNFKLFSFIPFWALSSHWFRFLRLLNLAVQIFFWLHTLSFTSKLASVKWCSLLQVKTFGFCHAWLKAHKGQCNTLLVSFKGVFSLLINQLFSQLRLRQMSSMNYCTIYIWFKLLQKSINFLAMPFVLIGFFFLSNFVAIRSRKGSFTDHLFYILNHVTTIY